MGCQARRDMRPPPIHDAKDEVVLTFHRRIAAKASARFCFIHPMRLEANKPLPILKSPSAACRPMADLARRLVAAEFCPRVVEFRKGGGGTTRKAAVKIEQMLRVRGEIWTNGASKATKGARLAELLGPSYKYERSSSTVDAAAMSTPPLLVSPNQAMLQLTGPLEQYMK
eukprot:scaffold88_cov223-Pinguiococcus_pyrenoidosus.AAC.3